MKLLRIVLVAGWFAAGCTPLSMQAVNSRALAPTPRLAPASQRITTPLYLVLDERAVPESAYIAAAGPRAALRVTDIREFVRRHMRDTLGRYFDRVVVVSPDQVPPGGHVARVRIARVGLTGHRNGEIYGQLDWTFSLRAEGQPEFRFSETSTGDRAVRYASHADQSIEATYRVALEHLVTALDEREVPTRLLAAESPSSL
jgi:hypothetical protein